MGAVTRRGAYSGSVARAMPVDPRAVRAGRVRATVRSALFSLLSGLRVAVLRGFGDPFWGRCPRCCCDRCSFSASFYFRLGDTKIARFLRRVSRAHRAALERGGVRWGNRVAQDIHFPACRSARHASAYMGRAGRGCWRVDDAKRAVSFPDFRGAPDLPFGDAECERGLCAFPAFLRIPHFARARRAVTELCVALNAGLCLLLIRRRGQPTDRDSVLRCAWLLETSAARRNVRPARRG